MDDDILALVYGGDLPETLPSNVASTNTIKTIAAIVPGIDTTAPYITSGTTTDDVTIVLVASERLVGTASAGVFSVSNNGIPTDPIVAGRTITITVNGTIFSGSTVTVGYTGDTITDGSNNALETFTPRSVTNNVTAAPEGSFIATYDSTIGYRSLNPGPGDGQFDRPRGITTTSENILVSDSLNHRVQMFDSDGNYQSQFGTSSPTNGVFNAPRGVATNSTHILVADTNNHRIQVFDLEYNYISQFGSFGVDVIQPDDSIIRAENGKFSAPYGITTNSTHILVADTGNDRIQIFDLVGNHRSSFDNSGVDVIQRQNRDGVMADFDRGMLSLPQGITTTSTNILVADTGNHRIQVFDLSGTHVSTIGSSGMGNGQFSHPQGITTNSTHILVSDTNNHRIQVFDLGGTLCPHNWQSWYG